MRYLLLFLILGACSNEPAELVCGRYDVSYKLGENETVNLNIENNDMLLKIAPSGSGARYVGSLRGVSVEFWNKGNDWTLILGNNAPINCEKPK